MASKKTKEKIGFKDLVTFAKAGWTPDDTNALLDRLEQIGDINDPDESSDEDGEDDADAGDASEDDEESDEDGDESDQDDASEDDDPEDDDPEDVHAKIKKLKKLGNEIKVEKLEELMVENERLKKDLQKLQKKNRNGDFSGGDNKSLEDSLIDTFQSCF